MSGSDYAKELFLDMLIHGWDIAIGSKQDTTLDSYLVEQCMPLGQVIAYNDNYRTAFKAANSGSESVNPQSHLFDLLGREG